MTTDSCIIRICWEQHHERTTFLIGTGHGLQQLIELEVAAFLGADRHERIEERLCYRNGYRPRTLTSQVGDLALQIPKLRAGSFLPSILEPRRRGDQALYAVIMEATIGGVSTRLPGRRPACRRH